MPESSEQVGETLRKSRTKKFTLLGGRIRVEIYYWIIGNHWILDFYDEKNPVPVESTNGREYEPKPNGKIAGVAPTDAVRRLRFDLAKYLNPKIGKVERRLEGEDEEEKTRAMRKAINFGANYGMGARKLQGLNPKIVIFDEDIVVRKK